MATQGRGQEGLAGAAGAAHEHDRRVIVRFHCVAFDLIFQADAAFVGVSACLKHPVTAVELVETLAQVIRGVNLVLPYALQLALEVEPLTRRELDVLVEMNKGMSDDEIAKRLNMCKYTVRTHAQHILQKLGVHTRRDAVHRARHRGLVPTPRQ
ncbi:MAG: response regulator transcription factor [Candidatus Brachytrichaceae bacterium NZ_4S206]